MYEPFERNFYIEHEDIKALNFYESAELRRKLDISVTGPDPPKPVSSFAHFGFDEKLMDAVCKSEYTQPTPIQAQGIPCALSGRDVIGIAKTGSGKTVTYLWPALLHIIDQVSRSFIFIQFLSTQRNSFLTVISISQPSPPIFG